MHSSQTSTQTSKSQRSQTKRRAPASSVRPQGPSLIARRRVVAVDFYAAAPKHVPPTALVPVHGRAGGHGPLARRAKGVLTPSGDHLGIAGDHWGSLAKVGDGRGMVSDSAGWHTRIHAPGRADVWDACLPPIGCDLVQCFAAYAALESELAGEREPTLRA